VSPTENHAMSSAAQDSQCATVRQQQILAQCSSLIMLLHRGRRCKLCIAAQIMHFVTCMHGCM